MNLERIAEFRAAADSEVAAKYGIGAAVNLEQFHEILDALTGAQAQVAVLLDALEVDSAERPDTLDEVRARLGEALDRAASGPEGAAGASEAPEGAPGSGEAPGSAERHDWMLDPDVY